MLRNEAPICSRQSPDAAHSHRLAALSSFVSSCEPNEWSQLPACGARALPWEAFGVAFGRVCKLSSRCNGCATNCELRATSGKCRSLAKPQEPSCRSWAESAQLRRQAGAALPLRVGCFWAQMSARNERKMSAASNADNLLLGCAQVALPERNWLESKTLDEQ